MRKFAMLQQGRVKIRSISKNKYKSSIDIHMYTMLTGYTFCTVLNIEIAQTLEVLHYLNEISSVALFDLHSDYGQMTGTCFTLYAQLKHDIF